MEFTLSARWTYGECCVGLLISMNDREGKEVYDLYGAVTADENGKYSSTLFLQGQWIHFADTRVETSSEYFLSSSRVVLLVYMKRYYPKQLRETILNKLNSE